MNLIIPTFGMGLVLRLPSIKFIKKYLIKVVLALQKKTELNNFEKKTYKKEIYF